MKKTVILFMLLTMVVFISQAEEIVSVEPVVSNGSLSFYLNSSNGDVSEYGVENLSCYSVESEGIFTYDVSYQTYGNSINVNFRMFNCFSNSQSVCCVVALHRNGVLEKIEFQNTEISANSVKEIILETIEVNPETDKIQAYVWDSISGMKPLGNSENIDSANSIVSRKYVYVNCNSAKKFKVYISSPQIAEYMGLNYIIEYDSSKIAVENLCAFSYSSILSCGYVKNTGINILEFSAGEGIVKYAAKSSKVLSGINNVIEFSAKESLVNEEIALVVTK